MSNMREAYEESVQVRLPEHNEESALEDLDNLMLEMQENFRTHFEDSIEAVEELMGKHVTITVRVEVDVEEDEDR